MNYITVYAYQHEYKKGNIMSKINLLELLQQDIDEIKGFIEYKKDELVEETMKNQLRAIILNLKDHLEEFVEFYS